MLRGSRIIKRGFTLNSLSRISGTLKVNSGALFNRFQSTVQKTDEDLSQPNNNAESPSPIQSEDLRKQRNKELNDRARKIENDLEAGLRMGSSSNELFHNLFAAIDETPYLKNKHFSLARSVNQIIQKSIEEISDPNASKIPVTPQEILNKAVFYRIANASNFIAVANDYIKNNSPRDVLPLWVSYVEYKAAKGLKFFPDEHKLVNATIVAFTELTAGTKPQVDNLKQLLKLDSLPNTFQLARTTDTLIPKSDPRSQIIKDSLNQLAFVSRNPNSIVDLKRAHEAAQLGDARKVSNILRDAHQISETNGIPLNEGTLTAYMSFFNVLNRPEEVFQIWNTLQKSNMKPSIDAWNQLLDAASKRGDPAKRAGQAQAIFQRIPEPNAETHAKLFEIYRRNNETQLANNLITQENLKSSLFVNAYLKSLASGQDISALEKALKKAQASGVRINLETYNKILSCFVKAKDFSKVRTLLNEMDASKIKPDVATFSIILDMNLKSITAKGEVPTAKVIKDFREAMTNAGLVDNVYTMTSVIDNMAKDASSYESAVEVFENLKKMNKLSIITYVAMISNSFKIHKSDHALQYFNELEESGLPLGPPQWSMLFEGLAITRNVEKAREYLAKVQAMPNSTEMLNRFSYYFLLRLALNTKNTDFANTLMNVILENKATKVLSKPTKGVIAKLGQQGVVIPEQIQAVM